MNFYHPEEEEARRGAGAPAAFDLPGFQRSRALEWGGGGSPAELAQVVASCLLLSYRGLRETGTGKTVSFSTRTSTSVNDRGLCRNGATPVEVPPLAEVRCCLSTENEIVAVDEKGKERWHVNVCMCTCRCVSLPLLPDHFWVI